MFFFFLIFSTLSEFFIEPGETSFKLQPNTDVEIELSIQFFNMFQFDSDFPTDLSIVNSKGTYIEHYTDKSLFIADTYVKIKNNLLENEILIKIWTGPFSICPNEGIIAVTDKTIKFETLFDKKETKICILNTGNNKTNTNLKFKEGDGISVTFYKGSDLSGFTKPYTCNSGCNFDSSLPYITAVSYRANKEAKIEVTVSSDAKKDIKKCYANNIDVIEELGFIRKPKLNAKISNVKCGVKTFTAKGALVTKIVFYLFISVVLILFLVYIVIKRIRNPFSVRKKNEIEKFLTKRDSSFNSMKEVPLEANFDGKPFFY